VFFLFVFLFIFFVCSLFVLCCYLLLYLPSILNLLHVLIEVTCTCIVMGINYNVCTCVSFIQFVIMYCVFYCLPLVTV
jgi:hypothetical protein